MKNREIILCSVIIFLICGMILYILLNNQSNTESIVKNDTSTKINQTSFPATKIITSTIKVTSYSLSDLSKHNSQTSCWTAINGKIYNITGFISSHPAGIQKILKSCGADATAMYGRVGAHDVSRLSNVYIGSLK